MGHGTNRGARGRWLFVGVPALVTPCAGGGVELFDLASGWQGTASGVVAEAVWEAIHGGTDEPGPVLAALGPNHPLAQLTARLAGAPRIELSAAAAITLDGLDTLFVELTGACSQRCVHCYADAAGPEAAALDRSTCEALIDDAAELGFRRVQLTGGEPLLCAFLPRLVERAASRGIPCCEIFTSGLELSPALLERIAPFEPALAFSFYAHDPRVHDEITRTPGSQARTAEAIARAIARGLAVRVAVVAMEQNKDHIEATIDYLQQLGVQQISCSGSHAVGRGHYYEGHLPPSRAMAPPRPADATARRRGRGKLCVTADGRVFPCIFNRADLLGRVPQRRLREIAAAPELPPPTDAGPEELLASCRQRLQCRTCQLTTLALNRAARPGGAG